MLQACNLYLNTSGGPGSYRAGPTALLITCVSGAKNMQTQQKIKKLAILLLAITLVLGLLVTTAVAMPGMSTFWPMDYDASNATGFPSNPYTHISISADEYPEVQELQILNDKTDDKDRGNIFYIVVIPNLDTKTATRNDYALTLTLTERNGNASTVKLAKANYYRPVQVKWIANNGRQCDLFIIAIPEIRDYTDADYTEASIYYLESLNKVQALYDVLSTSTKAVVGGYHPQNFRCLQKICRNYSGTVLSFGWSDAYVSNPPELSAIRRNFSERSALAPDQAAAFFTDILPYYMDYCRQPIEKPELSSLQVMGSEAVAVSDTEYALYLPEGTDWKKANGSLNMVVTAPYSAVTSGTWAANTTITLDIYAKDPATNTVYDTEKSGRIVSSYIVKLYSGAPNYAVTAFQINDRIANIDEDNRIISLHLAKNWSWSQVPQITNSGTSYEFLDADGQLVAPDADGKIDFAAAKKLRLIEDLTSYAQTGFDTAGLYYTKDYTLNITQGNSSECKLFSYSVGVTGEAIQWGANNTITVTIPYADNWSNLKSSYTASYDATVTVLGTEDFEHSETTPIKYRVTAENGTSYQDYSVVVKMLPASSKNELETFNFGTLLGKIDHVAGTVTLELPAGSSKRFAPSITLPEFATVEPASGVLQDFTEPVVYTVTAQNGETKRYTVTVTVSTQRQENPDKSKYESLLNAIIDKYRDSASDDWEWMQLGIYENKRQSDGPNTNNDFDIAKEIKDLNVGSNGTMTDVARLIMLLTSRGYDCSNLAQYNDGAPFTDKVGNQIDNLIANLLETKSGTIFGVSFGLCALDMGNYSVPANAARTRESLLDTLLQCTFDPPGMYGMDEVGMVMYAFAPYQDDPVYGERVRAKLDDGVAAIVKYMREDYTFVYGAQVNSETTAQVICALASCGIDPYSDPRFGNGTTTVLTQWMDLFATSDGFKHTQDGTTNAMATYQSCYALQWYLGLLNNDEAGRPYHLYYHRYDFSTAFSTDADILSFSIEGQNGKIETKDGKNTITVTLPKGMPLQNITPDFTLSEGATLAAPTLPVTFVENVAQPFTVLAEDGLTTKTYEVTVTFGDVDPAGARIDTSTIVLQDANQRNLDILDKAITEKEDGADILLTVSSGIDVTKLRVIANISYRASASPVLDGSVNLDLSDWTEFAITSADGKNHATYRIKVQAKTVASITAFSLTINGKVYDGDIDNVRGTISVTGVDDSNLTTTKFAPDITLGAGTTVCSPLSGTEQDFSAPVIYTVAGRDVESRTYTVRVTNTAGSLISASGETPTPSSSARIEKFTVLGVDGEIDHTAGTIEIVLPNGTDVTAVAPVVTVPAGAVVSPVSGEVVNLSTPLTYTVRLGSETRYYVVRVVYQRSTSQQLWDKVSEDNTVTDHQESRSTHRFS